MHDDTNQISLSRRDALRWGAGAVAGGSLAAGASIHPDLDGPVGPADGFLVSSSVIAAAGIALIAGGSGMAIGGWAIQQDMGVDGSDLTTDQLQNELYDKAQIAAQTRDSWVEDKTDTFIDRSVGESPFAHNGWQSVRAAAAAEIVNGNGVLSAKSEARDALRGTHDRAIIDVTAKWNEVLSSLAPSFVEDLEYGAGVFAPVDSDGTKFGSIQAVSGDSFPQVDASNFDPVNNSEVGSGQYAIFKHSPAVLKKPISDYDRSEFFVLGFVNSADEINTLLASNSKNEKLGAYHPDISDHIDIIGQDLYGKILTQIQNEYDAINNDLDTYIDALANGIHEGEIDPATILDGHDIYQNFSDSDEQSRLAAAMLTSGLAVPDSEGYLAEISHDDLGSDSLWVDLYPRWGDGNDPIPITAGTTIESSQYDMAVIGYASEQDGSYRTRWLSGGSPLEILAVDNVSDQKSLSISSEATAGAGGRVVVYEGDDPPTLLTDERGGSVTVTGASNESTHDLTEIKSQDGQHYLETTSLSEGEAIEAIEIAPAVNYEETDYTVPDATDVDTEREKRIIEEQSETIEDLEDALDSSGGGAGLDLGVFGDPRNLAIIAGVGGAGALYLNNKS